MACMWMRANERAEDERSPASGRGPGGAGGTGPSARRARWGVYELDGERYDLAPEEGIPLRPSAARGTGEPDAPARLVAADGPGGDEWVLLAGRAASGSIPEGTRRGSGRVMVNGTPLCASGIRVLRDRDEIQPSGAEPMFFSKERLARVEPCPRDGVVCPRCRQPIRRGTPAVRCPNPRCGAWHHQDEESGFTCWTYGAECAGDFCSRPTGLDDDFSWTPVDL